MIQELCLAWRMLMKRPGFTLVAVMALALGIGANSAIFGVVEAVLLQPLPFMKPERLVAVWETNPEQNRNEVALGNYLDWRARNEAFDQLAAFYYANVNLTGVGEPERVPSELVTSDLFQTLGVQPIHGRAFLAEEEKIDGPRVAIISHGLWQRRFGSDPGVVGKVLSLNGNPTTVIGVMPADFALQFPTSMQVEMWLPMRIDPAAATDRKSHYLYVLGRLKQGVSIRQAQIGMSAMASQLEEQFPETNASKGANVVSLHQQLVGGVRSYLYVLFGAVGFVLLIACANVANLLLARAAARKKEVALRIALGASRWRLVRQFLTESILLSCIGGLFGLLLASWATEVLVALTPPEVPRLHEIGLHAPVLVWTLLLCVGTGLLTGLVPALQASRSGINDSLKGGGGRGAGPDRLRLFVISEVALALVLLIGAGLMLKSFARLQHVDPGFDVKNVITMNIALPRQKYPDAKHANLFFAQLFQRIRVLPGIESVGGIDPLPLSDSNGTTGFVIEGRPMLATADRPEADQRVIAGNYFGTMRIAVLKGRALTEEDRQDAPRRIVINEAFAHRFWPAGDAIGKRLGFDDGPNQNWWEIAGIVGNVKHERLDAQAKPEVYFAYEQSPNNFMTLVARTSRDPANMIAALHTQILALDPDQPVFDVKTMEQRLVISVAKTRFVLLLLSAFSILALLLAALGIFGVMAYAVTQRTREIGIRLALGAQTRDVLRIVLWQGMTLTVTGVAIGLAAAFGLTRVMGSLLYGVAPTDAPTFVSVSVLLLGVALLACSIPARRASKVNPIDALRYE